MYVKTAECACVTQGADQMSQPVQMTGVNAVQISLVVMSFATGATSVTLTLEGSNDLENWATISSWTCSWWGSTIAPAAYQP